MECRLSWRTTMAIRLYTVACSMPSLANKLSSLNSNKLCLVKGLTLLLSWRYFKVDAIKKILRREDQSDSKRLAKEKVNNLELAVGYLESWEDRIAIPRLMKNRSGIMTDDEGVVINPKLSEFQHLIASSVRDILVKLPIEHMSYVILGYLSPIDLLKG